MLKALRKADSQATLAHLAYARTMEAPVQVKPISGIFLEFAPIARTWSEPISHREAEEGQHGRYLDFLDSNLAVFGRDDAQVLEYWLDVSLFSSWRREAKKKLPWRRDVFLQDIAAYANRGIRHVTSFAVYVDADYVQQYGEPPLDEYGKGLRDFLKPQDPAIQAMRGASTKPTDLHAYRWVGPTASLPRDEAKSNDELSHT